LAAEISSPDLVPLRCDTADVISCRAGTVVAQSVTQEQSMNVPAGIVYGPQVSRRFGRMLGVNLAPDGHKACNFECVYCSQPWTEPPHRQDWADPADILAVVHGALETCGEIDTILVAGNGEPTLHPAFAAIAEELFLARQRLAPSAKLALLSNGSTLHRLEVVNSLGRFDSRCMKFDAGDATTYRLMNAAPVTLGRLIADLRQVGRLTLQSTFVHDVSGAGDNTTPRALQAWLAAVTRIGPDAVDLCTVDRTRPGGPSVKRVSQELLEGIADQLRALGVTARVFA